MNTDQVQRLVTEVISRLAPRLGADGSQGTLLAVFTGAGIGFDRTAAQIRGLILDGFRIKMAFSPAAESLFKAALVKKLDGFPFLDEVSPHNWLAELEKCRAVVVPLFSVNTLSKITLLVADTLAANLILQGLFLGRPVIAARDGVDPYGPDRTDAGLNQGSPALLKALASRLQTFRDYGGYLTESQNLRQVTNSLLGSEKRETRSPVQEAPRASDSQDSPPVLRLDIPLLTGADIGPIQTRGTIMEVPTRTVITPLARDQILKKGIKLVRKK